MKKFFNIFLALLLAATVAIVAYAVASGGSEAAVSLNIVWGYILLGLGLFAAVVCAVAGMVSSPDGVKGTLISVGLVAVIVGASYAYASGNSLQISNIETGGVFGAEETVITESSVLVTYVVCGAAVVMALVSEVLGAFK